MAVIFSTSAQPWLGSGDIYYTGGNVGIGTASPAAELDVHGDIKLNGGTQNLKISNLTGSESGYGSFVNYGGLAINGDNGSNRQMFMFSDGSGTNNVFTVATSLDAGSSWYPRFVVQQSGNVGIGKINPDMKLTVHSSAEYVSRFHHDGTSTISGVRVGKSASYMDIVNLESGSGFGSGTSSGTLPLSTQSSDEVDLFINNSNGNVGIGTATPDSKLSVNGTIHTKEVKVDLDGWSDHVFKDDYELMNLEEVSTYITENHHLPNIPTESEVKENGINLGEMNAKLLEKIEELTLYVIDLKEENVKQQQEINQLKTNINHE